MPDDIKGKSEKKRRRGCRRFWPLVLIPLIPVIFYTLVVFLPQVFFPFNLSHENFNIHMRSKVPAEIRPVLDKTDELLRKSEFYDPATRYDVYIINSFRLSRVFLTKNVHFGCTPFNGDIFIVKTDIENDKAFCEMISENDSRSRALSETIAHEVAHNFIRDYTGISRDRELPQWLKEGYCEYVAEGSALDIDYAFHLLRTNPYAFDPGFLNFKSRLMVEYLMRIKSMTIIELIASPPDRQVVEQEMLKFISDGNDIIR